MLAVLLVLVAGTPEWQEPRTEAGAGPRAAAIALFDGRSLAGWTGNTGHWSVEDGCLVGRTTAGEPLAQSVYLFHELAARDFVLEFEYRLDGGNSGVQYRSRRLPGGGVAGYQADFEAGPHYTGILYESAGRGIVATRGQRLTIRADGTRAVEDEAFGDAAALQEGVVAGDWNHYRVEARGPLLIHQINGRRMIAVRDEDPEHARRTGLFALQLHQGPPMEMRYRNLRLTRLPAAQATVPEWIWGPEPARDGEARWFHHVFVLDRPAVLQRGAITCDNAFTAWLDGAPLARGEDWAAPAGVDAGLALDAGRHVLAVHARNQGGPAGLVAHLPWTDEDGRDGAVVTSEAWWTAPAAGSAPQAPAPEPQTPAPEPQAPAPLPAGAVSARSFGPVGDHVGPWGDLLAVRPATPEDAITVPDGYRVERVHSAGFGEGSWASFTFADDGSAYACGERGGLLRFRFPHGHDAPPVVEHPVTPVHAAQGLEWVGDALYANVAGPAAGDGGLHRLRDADGDGVFEEHARLQAYGPASEHGAHGIRLGPDGMLYLVHGNYTDLPPALDREASPFRHWAEDELLPRLWDPRGHAHGIHAPGGVVLRTDLDGRRWELVAGGMRNPYDLDFAPGGELFTYDADMEWDVGAPWYRAPRVVQVVPGGESGWRSGSAKWPAQYPDSLPPVLETGPSSPVGVRFGTGAAFPERMQRALFLGDWAYGRILAAHLEPDGAGWRGTTEDFLSGRPLPVTDLEIGPDGALWFITGGRGAQSGLYRVVYAGDAPHRPLSAAQLRRPETEAARLRKRLAGEDIALQTIRAGLGHADRIVRYAARTALEWDAAARAALWKDSGLPARARGESLLARARVDAGERAAEIAARLAEEVAAPSAGRDPAAAAALRWLYLRTAMLLHVRGAGQADDALRGTARRLFDGAVARGDEALQREAARLLVALGADGLPTLLMRRFRAADFPAARIHYALLLRLCADGWIRRDREELLTWLRRWRAQPGGLSLGGFLQAIERDVLAQLPEEEAAALRTRLPDPSPPEAFAATPRPFVRAWTVAGAEEELRRLAAQGIAPDPERGRELYREAGCIACHRHSGEGGSLAPDLTGAGARFDRRALLEAILEPAAQTSDQYPWSVMPPGLVDSLEARELADLLAFLRAQS